MASRTARRVTGTVADLHGITDDELRLALTVAAVAASVIAALRLLRFLGDLGSDVLSRARR
jgi:hypothetical protein